MTKYPIPDAALDDRQAIVGTSGSGKTHAACTAVERLLAKKARVVVVDPLGVWYGLRLKPDGVRPAYPVVIFGGSKGDLPINEAAGGLVGETIATMAESCIVALDGLGSKAAERRFMLAFLEKLYRKATGEPFHIIFDEADLWAPQKSSEPQLQNMMEQIVRRGRVKGFIPWLITQRPAVLSKDVLSQADGLIAMKLTSSQDRDAIGGWIEGQADRADEKRMLARLPQLERGRGVVWIPGRSILEEVKFPERETFDSSRTPKRGETVRSASLKPIDLGAVKQRLASIEDEVKANDPKALKAKVADLARQLAAKAPPPAASTPESDAQVLKRPAVRQAIAEASAAAANQAAATTRQGMLGKLQRILKSIMPATEALAELTQEQPPKFDVLDTEAPRLGKPIMQGAAPERLGLAPATKVAIRATAPPRIATNGHATSDGVTAPQQRILDGLMWFEAIGIAPASKDAVAFMADASSTSGGYFNNLGKLRSAGLIDYPTGGMVALTDQGRAAATQPDQPGQLSDLHDAVRRKLPTPMQRILDEALRVWPQSLPKNTLAEQIGVSPTSGGYFNNLGRLRTLGLIDYPSPGEVQATEILFPESLR